MYLPASCLIALARGDWHADCSFSIFQKMDRKASLSDVQRARIVTLHEEGYSERKIAVKMAYSKTAVHTTINNFELYANYSGKKKSVRPRKTSRRDNHMMKLSVSRSPTSSCQKIRANLLQKTPKTHFGIFF